MSPGPDTITRRTVLSGLAALGAAMAVPGSATAATPVVVGRIRSTYRAAGGASRLGRPLADEVRVVVDGRNTYGQRFERGTVWWGSGVGKVDVSSGSRVRLASAPNFRPVLGVRDVWRADDLDGCSALDERIVTDLGVTTMVAMNTGRDPSIAGVRWYGYPISNAGTETAFYRGYVSRSASRTAVGRVLTVVGASRSPVIVHCTAGKDRTGWVSDLLQAVAGVPLAQRDAGYLASHAYSGVTVDLAWLRAARGQLSHDYGTVDAYLQRGCGMTAAAVAGLRVRLAPATR